MESLVKIERLWRYPVKSLLGESCTELKIDRRGVKGDRLFAINKIILKVFKDRIL